MTTRSLLALTVCTLAFLPLPLAHAEVDVTEGVRHQSVFAAYPQPLCGASHQTGINWVAAFNSIGFAEWKVVFTYQYLTTGGVYGSGVQERYTTTDTGRPDMLWGSVCGSWLWCNAQMQAYWYDGANWQPELPITLNVPCVRLP